MVGCVEDVKCILRSLILNLTLVVCFTKFTSAYPCNRDANVYGKKFNFLIPSKPH